MTRVIGYDAACLFVLLFLISSPCFYSFYVAVRLYNKELLFHAKTLLIYCASYLLASRRPRL